MIITDRRSLLRGLFAMPAIVAASSIMPVKLFSIEEPIVGLWIDSSYMADFGTPPKSIRIADYKSLLSEDITRLFKSHFLARPSDIRQA
jgi:hypothetical protein